MTLDPRSGPGRAVLGIVLGGALLRIALAAFVTHWVLVDDAYITLRYARHGAETGALVYNQGEAVFGVTSPLWGFVTAGLYGAVGRAWIEVAVVLFGVLAWALATVRLCERIQGAGVQRLVAALMTFAPVFVDNALLGMETPMFACLAVLALAAASDGAIGRAALWAGLLVVARPEGVLFAPALIGLAARRVGARGLLAQLARPRNLAALAGPSVAWATFAMLRYGTVVPASMVAKSGWNNAHYDALQSLSNAWLGVARLTFVPFVDAFPVAVGHVIAGAVALGAAWIGRAALRSRDPWSCAWFGTWVLYIAFYLLGKGATEASWYAVPSSVALLAAAGPAIGALELRLGRPRWAPVGAACAFAALSVFAAHRRAPLLQSYVDGYGACARTLATIPQSPDGTPERVLIGEIGVFGFESDRDLIDVGALVSPEVLPLKNEGLSLAAIARRTDAHWLVISDIALERNHYPSVGRVWANDEERRWVMDAEVVCQHRDKSLRRVKVGFLPTGNFAHFRHRAPSSGGRAPEGGGGESGRNCP